jgi:hypothetical protein
MKVEKRKRNCLGAYLNHVHNLGTPTPDMTKTKYEYRTTSVTLHATNILLYAGLYCVVCGKL